jgi:hypothetical protein
MWWFVADGPAREGATLRYGLLGRLEVIAADGRGVALAEERDVAAALRL